MCGPVQGVAGQGILSKQATRATTGSWGAQQGTIGNKVRSVDDGFISVANSCLACADNQ